MAKAVDNTHAKIIRCCELLTALEVVSVEQDGIKPTLYLTFGGGPYIIVTGEDGQVWFRGEDLEEIEKLILEKIISNANADIEGLEG